MKILNCHYSIIIKLIKAKETNINKVEWTKNTKVKSYYTKFTKTSKYKGQLFLVNIKKRCFIITLLKTYFVDIFSIS